MIKLIKIIGIPKSRSLFALGVFEVVSALAGELDYLVGSFLIWAEFPFYQVLGVSNNVSQNEISN